MNDTYVGVINTEETTARPGAGVVINPNNTLTGYSLGTQFVDSLTGGSITVRELAYNEMTREKTLEEMQNIRSFLEAKYKAEQAEQLSGWGRTVSGWKVASIQEDIARDANEIRSIRAKGGDADLEQALQDRISRNKWRMSQIAIPEETGAWSAYNIGSGVRSMVPGLLMEIPFMAGEVALGALFIPKTGGVSLGAGAIAAGRRFIKARRLSKAAYNGAKYAAMWDAFSRREEGSMYSDIMDRTDLTEEQKAAMAVTYGRLSGAVELLGWNLGAGGLAMKGIKSVSKRFASPVEKWTADATFKNTIKEQMKQEAERTIKGKVLTAAKAVGKAGLAAGAETMEEGTQRAMELATLQQGLRGETPNVATVVGEGFAKLAGVPVELVQGKLSDESISILDAMGAAIFPSLLVGGAGIALSGASRAAEAISPADSGRVSGFTIKNNSLKSAILSAEKNAARLTAISTFMGDQSQNTDYKLQVIDGMVKNAELEGQVHFAPEDAEVLIALGETSPTLKNTLAKLGISKAISEGKKVGTVSVPMRDFAILASQPEVRESEVGKRLNVSGTLDLADSSYSRIERNVIAGNKKGKELLAKPTPKLERKLKGLRRQFESAGFSPEETEANLAVFTSALATLAEASNGAVTADELIDEFKFNIEKREYDIKNDNIEDSIKKILSDKREILGMFSRATRKPISSKVSKLNVESVAAEMARIDAEEKTEHKGDTIKINGKERSVYNSHGVRIAKSTKALKAFYKWFGNSKAVDELDRPKVLYHGTPAGGFLAFDKAMIGDRVPWTKQGFWFTDDISVATSFAGNDEIITREIAEKTSAGDIDPSAGIYQVYLKMETPLIEDYQGSNWTGEMNRSYIIRDLDSDTQEALRNPDGTYVTFDTAEEAYEYLEKNPGVNGFVVRGGSNLFLSTDELAEQAKDNEFDGCIIKNVVDYGGRAPSNEESNVYVVFEPEQIKSTDNYGMFDPNAVDMYRSVVRTAYAGSPVDYLLPALKAIGTGEGHFAHGWGLYYALAYDVADRYRRRYMNTGARALWDGAPISKKIHETYGGYSSALYLAINRAIGANRTLAEQNRSVEKLVKEITKTADAIYQARVARRNYAVSGLDATGEEDAIKSLTKKQAKLKEELENINKEWRSKDMEGKVISEIKESVLDDMTFHAQTVQNRVDTNKSQIKKYEDSIKTLEQQRAEISKDKKKAIQEKIQELSKTPVTYSQAILEQYGVTNVDEYIEALAEEKVLTGFDSMGELIKSLKQSIQYSEETIARDQKILESLRLYIKEIQGGAIEKNLSFSDAASTGQIKEVTVRKIDTFMREDAPMFQQTGFVKKAIQKMLDSEESVSELASLLGSELSEDSAEEAKKRIVDAADKKLSEIPMNYKKPATETILDDYFGWGFSLQSIRKMLEEDLAKEKRPKYLSVIKAKIQALDILEPYIRKESVRASKVESSAVTAWKIYTGMVNIFLGKAPEDSSGKYEKKEVHEAKKKASLMLQKYGINGISYNGHEDGECLVVFDSSTLRVKQSYFSRRKDMPSSTPVSAYELFDEDVGMRGPKKLYVARHADVTTFAHEVMHFVTRSLIEMYNDGSISETWKRYVDKLYEYFSIMPSSHGPAAMHKKDGKITMEFEASETLSGGFEQYIQQGKASDSALEKLYAFIKDLAADLWNVLNRGYFKDQALSDVQIQFYDKVMQAHTDIKTTEYKYGYAPLEQLEGVSDEEYEMYTLERKVARAKSSNTLFKAQRQMVKNRKRAEWIKFYDEEFLKAREELSSQPEYQVMAFIRENGGLNKTSFKSGTRLWASVPEKYFNKKDAEGVTVEQLTAKFGPEISIADIAKILADTPSLDVAARRRARSEADRRFLEEFEPAADITPANAMRTIFFIRSLVKESLMIKGEPLSSFPAHYAAWIKEAENYFMGLTVRNAKDLEKWANMESRVTDDFMSAFTSGNTDLASLKADQRAMVNYVLVRSKQLRKLEAKFKRQYKKFYSAPAGKDIKVMDGVTWNLIHTILQEYGFTRKKGRLSASAKEQFVAWCEMRKGKQYFPYETMMNELNLLSGIPKNSSLTVERFNRLYALIEQIRAIGESEKIVFDGEKRAQLDVVTGAIIDNIMKIRQRKGDKAFLEYAKGSWSRLTVPQMGMLEPIFGDLGMRHLFVQLRNALVARDDLADNTRAFVADSFERNRMGDILADKTEFKIGDRTVNNHILLFALQHSGNDHNRDNAIKTLQQYYRDDSFSEGEFEDFLNATPAGMRNYVNDLWTMFKNMKTLIDDQTRVATGELIATVEAKPYTLRDGTEMSGGYFPAKKVNKIGITDPLDSYFDNNFLYPRAGLLKDRVKNATGNLDLSQDALSRWIFQAVNLATTQVAFNDIATVFQDKAVIEALGPNATLVTQYVNDWLQCAVLPVAPQPKALRAIAKGPTVLFLGFKAVSGLVQLLGTMMGLTEVSVPSLFKSSGKLLNVGKYFKITEEMSKRSAFMADRARKFDTRFFGLMKDENMLQKATRKYGDGIVTASMTFVRTFQCMADMVVWDGAYADGKKSGMTDKEASDHADGVVMKTQGDRVQMNTPDGFQGVLRFFQPFMTYILTLNQIGSAALRSRNFKKFGTLVAMIVLSNMLEAYFKENDKEWRRKLLGKKTKGTDKDFWQRYRNRFLVQTVSTLGDVAIPFAGLGSTLSLSLTEDMLKSVSPGYRAYKAGAIPGVEVLEKAAKAITLDEKTWKSVYDWDMSLGANLVDFAL